jgi:hypothetical protein
MAHPRGTSLHQGDEHSNFEEEIIQQCGTALANALATFDPTEALMNKRHFRRRTDEVSEKPTYPTLDEFDLDRRRFLTRLSGALLGAGALAALQGCGDRALGLDHEEDSGWRFGGARPEPDAGIDGVHRDGAGAQPDLGWIGGTRPEPDALVVPGGPNLPDARGDGNDGGTKRDLFEEPDSLMLGGVARVPDARLDEAE